MIDPIAKPFAATALSSGCKGHVGERVELAKSEIWPDGMPSGLHVSVRNKMIANWFIARRLDVPSVRHLQRLHGGR